MHLPVFIFLAVGAVRAAPSPGDQIALSADPNPLMASDGVVSPTHYYTIGIPSTFEVSTYIEPFAAASSATNTVLQVQPRNAAATHTPRDNENYNKKRQLWGWENTELRCPYTEFAVAKEGARPAGSDDRKYYGINKACSHALNLCYGNYPSSITAVE